jgi:hypothetical protein
MTQSRKLSAIESGVRTIVSYVSALLLQIVTFPMFGIEVDLHTNIAIGFIFMAHSFVWGYVFRRVYNDN